MCLLSPGVIVSTNILGGGRVYPPQFVNKMLETTPLGRPGIPLDIAKGVVFLASPLAEWIDGINILITGGFYGAFPNIKS